MDTILVTGGAGYIGSHTVRALQAAGYQPVVFDNLAKGHRQAVEGAPLLVGDVADGDALDQAFQNYSVAAVVHFAAWIEAGESVRDPGKYFQNNTAGSLNLLQAMVRNRVDRLVFSSTAAVYGEPRQVPIREEDPKEPTNAYGLSKLMVEQMLDWFHRAYGLRSISLRYFNAAGADPEGRIGEDHEPETHLIPLILQVALGKRERIAIFGDDYETPDGTCIRDYIHVNDLAGAHILALRSLAEAGEPRLGREADSGPTPGGAPGARGPAPGAGRSAAEDAPPPPPGVGTLDRAPGGRDAFNVGNGAGFSVRQVIETARQVTGHPIPAEVQPRRPGDPARLVASSEKLQRTLGWQPRLADLSTIIATAWRWYQAHPDGYAE